MDSDHLTTRALPIGLLTVSDREEYTDLSIPAIEQTLSLYFYDEIPFIRMSVAYDKPAIEDKLRHLADDYQCCVVFTTGGIGPSPRDVTPDATVAVCDKLLPGYGEAMRSVLRARGGVVTALLSRQQAGVRNKTLIVNLPDAAREVESCLEVILPCVSQCVELLQGEPILHPFSSGGQPFIHPV